MGPEILAAQKDGLAGAAKRFVELTGARNVEEHLLFGPLATALKGFAEDTGAHLIVMGRRGEGGSRFFGSNTTDVIKSSAVPVLAVPERARLHGVQRILLADDHHTVRPETLHVLRTIAETHEADVLVAHYSHAVGNSPAHWSNAQYDVGLKGITHTFIGMHGKDVIDGLERTAQKRKADLIAVVHRHTGLLDGLFHNSVAKELAETSASPLLVLEQRD
jgi:nucleotide-binding universal stress UspA family protein